MKLSLPHFLAIFSIVICLPTLQAQQVEPQHFEDIPAIKLLNKIPSNAQVNVLKSYSSLELLKLYDTLLDIKKEIPANIARENKVFQQEFIDEKGNFKGDEILSSIQTAAGYKVGRILGCTLKEMNNGTCQPLKDSDGPGITPEEKAAQPFAEATGAWTRDWVHLLPIVEIFDERSNSIQWKINFINTIQNVDNNIPSYLDNSNFIVVNVDDRLNGTYLLTFPASLQNELLARLKQNHGYREIYIPRVPKDFSPYFNYQVDQFLKKDKRLKFKDIGYTGINVDYLRFVYDNRRSPKEAILSWWPFGAKRQEIS